MQNPDTQSSVAICILGMHRGGTSALARLINLAGVEFANDLISPRRGNPTGFWEHRKIVDIHEQLLDALHSSFDDFLPLENDWLKNPATESAIAQLLELIRRDFGHSLLWGFKDPRASRLLPMWDQIFRQTGADGRYIISLRDPREISQSLALRDGISLNQALLSTLSHLLDAEAHTRGKRRVIVSFEQILSDWRQTLMRIASELSIDWPRTFPQIEKEADAFLDPSLRHHKSTGPLEESLLNSGADKQIASWISQAHDALTTATTENNAINTQTLDRINREFLSELPGLVAWRGAISLYYKVAQLEDWTQTLNREKAALAARLASLQSHATELEEHCEQLKSSAEADRLRLQQEREQLEEDWARYRHIPGG
jgi:hypothetical protein